MALFKKSNKAKASKEIAKERLIALVSAEREMDMQQQRPFLSESSSDAQTYRSHVDSFKKREID